MRAAAWRSELLLPVRCARHVMYALTLRPLAGTTVAAPRQLVVHGDARAVAAAVERAELEYPLRACPLDRRALSAALTRVAPTCLAPR